MRIPITYLILTILAVVVLCVAKTEFGKIGDEAQRLSKIQSSKDLAAFRENVKKVKDPEMATKRAVKFLNSGETQMAVAIMEQAATLDKNYRDASFFLGYSYLKDIQMRQADLSVSKQHAQMEKAKAALLTAQKIDPLYPMTNKLLGMISQNEKNDKEKQLWYARYETVKE